MDPVLFAIVTRALERILVVATGALAIYLGYRLFVNMPEQDKGTGKIALPGGISIFLSRVGPGVFFSLFGAVVIALSFHYGISYDEQAATAASDAPAVRRSLSGIAPATSGTAYEKLGDRNAALVTITALNRAAGALRPDIPPYERKQILDGIHDAKLRIMEGIWDAEHWGDFDAFVAWARKQSGDAPPSELTEAASYFRDGME